MISFNNALGERLITLHTVRNSVDQASLWNTITMEVSSYFPFDFCMNDKSKETYLSCRTSVSERFNEMGELPDMKPITKYPSKLCDNADNSKISISEYMEEKHKGSVRNVVAYNLLGANERGAFSRFLANLSRYCMSCILTLFRLCCMEVVNIVVEYCIHSRRGMRLGGVTENTTAAAAAAAAANAVNFILLSTNSESPTYTSGAAALRGNNTLPTRSNNHDYKIDNSMNVMCYWYRFPQ
uniref:Uncharacterized protein n=1 Tax=Glossina austeni TaxID=7395 RepID=A0A1A9UTB9_GLOAU